MRDRCNSRGCVSFRVLCLADRSATTGYERVCHAYSWPMPRNLAIARAAAIAIIPGQEEVTA